MAWPRPIPTTGDQTSSAERAGSPAGWALPEEDARALARVIAARRDIRRFRPDAVEPGLLWSLFDAAHRGPSVGHSQPWRFVVVQDPTTRQRAAVLADRARLAQAAALDDLSGRELLDLDLEGIREAPVGIVVCCDRRSPAAGVLGRATIPDADIWSCAAAIENLWLAARAAGLGVGWVTLFQPDDLVRLVGAPEGVVSLGWLCVGWPDERPPAPGLERRGWSERRPLDEVVLAERWPTVGGPMPPPSRLRPPEPAAVVAARDGADRLLAPPGALGALDRVVDRVLALEGGAEPKASGAGAGGAGASGAGAGEAMRGALVLVAADHPVAALGVSAYPTIVTRHVVEAALAGRSLGALTAARAGLGMLVVDAGVEGADVPGARPLRAQEARGDLVVGDALGRRDVDRLVDAGRTVGWEAARPRPGCRGGRPGRGGCGQHHGGRRPGRRSPRPRRRCRGRARLRGGSSHGGPQGGGDRRGEAAMGGAGRGRDSVGGDGGRRRTGAGGARRGVPRRGRGGGGDRSRRSGYLCGRPGRGDGRTGGLRPCPVAGQRSRERGHGAVLDALGLEPLLDLRLRAGEGVGACLAVELVASGLELRRRAATTA